jgi:tetratricopeptide (TPR) repeat protein
MPVKTEKELSEQLRSHWLKAVAAIELRNFDYAISLLQGILRQEPEFLTGRQLLRRAEVTKQKATKKALFNVSAAALSVMKAQRELKKDPKRAVEMIEKVLEDEPYNRQANLILKQAAVAAGWPEVGVFALRTVLEEKPSDERILHELGRLYHELGESDQEVEIYNKLNEIDPADAEALRLGKDAAARASMKTGGWTQAESYRDLIKDKEAAVSLEQQSRMALTGESLEQQIEETYVRHQAEPQSVDHARRLGVLYEQKEDTENAIAWYHTRLTSQRAAMPLSSARWRICNSPDQTARSPRTRSSSPATGRTRRTTRRALKRSPWRRNNGPSYRSTTRANVPSATRPICSFASNWANVCSRPAGHGKRYRSCSAPGRIRTRG